MSEKNESKAAGGKARAKALTSEERREISRKAAIARWEKAELEKIPQAQATGEVRIVDVSIPCAVLSDGTRLLTQAGFLLALGRSPKPKGRSQQVADGLPPFLSTVSLKPLISKEIIDSTVPVVFRTESGSKALGYRAELLPKVCDLFLQARAAGLLTVQQSGIAEKCEILVRGLAQTGITALIDEATGYQEVRPKDALQAYLEKIIRKDLAAWAKKFPDEFYENIYKLRGWVWPGMQKNRFSVVAHYTRDLIYERMAPGLLQELEEKTPKDESGKRKHKMQQWLSADIGDPMLASHMQSILTVQRICIANGWGWVKFTNMVDQIMPKKGDTLALPLPMD
ncbi:P63C domain-containing protein [Pseudomonas aeruginosa]|uniref:P63C domain-containing protein n=1 Tax=Pseudomonas aeruginosa TaxID=287 RepID=UPI000FF77D5E|nr:P63C domain-containing protein [Pseudomonas aeruginosa]RQC00226.1 hypothetical protein IPC393_22650 [Pseudomonas aeruginosa]